MVPAPSQSSSGTPTSPAAGYPSHWEADVVLRDGTTMRIRPIRPDDAGALQDLHAGQSEQSVYFRFFAQLARLSDRDLARFTQVDHTDRVALVLVEPTEDGERILAVGRFDRLETDGDVAEIAFNVADAAQGRGLGSILLEHLAAAGRERGIRRFSADVLPSNTRMLRVFTDAGYDVVQRYADGVVEVAVPIRPTDRALAVLAERERRAGALSMAALLGADGVLVHGVGEEGELLAARVLASVRESSFGGDVVHVRDLTGLQELRDAPPLAVVAAPPQDVLAALPLLARAGVRAVVLASGGFTTTGEPGRTPQASLVRTLREAGLRLAGPRSFGLLASGAHGPLPATLGHHPPIGPGDVGIFCQSPAAARALLDGVGARRLGLSTFLSSGHRVDVSGNDAMQYWSTHAGTAVACVYLESIGNPRTFSRVARGLAAGRPVVAAIAGRTGQQRVPGHPVRTSDTPPEVLTELMRQAGVLVADSARQLLDWAMVLSSQPLPEGDRVLVVTNSGSQAAVVAELLADAGLLPGPHRVVEPTVDDVGFAAALAEAAAEGSWDAALVGYGPFGTDATAGVTAAIARFAVVHGRPTVAVVPGVVGLDPALEHEGRTVPVLAESADALAALGAARRHARRRATEPGTGVDPTGVDRRGARRLVQGELAAVAPGTSVRLAPERTAELLAAYGIEVWPARRVTELGDALAAARETGWPVALKAGDDLLRHRADLGGVRLDLSTPAELTEAWRAMTARLGALGRRHPTLEVQRMAPPGAACVVRAVEDQLYGPLISFGLGGDATELLGDVAHRVPPLTDTDVAALVRSVRAAPRLLGWRGLPALDVAAVEDVVARVSVLKEELAEVSSVVLNPVLAGEQGVAILSATVDLAPAARGDLARRALP